MPDMLVTESDRAVGLEEEDEVSASGGVDACVVCTAGAVVVVGDVTAAASYVVVEAAAAPAGVVEVVSAPASAPAPFPAPEVVDVSTAAGIMLFLQLSEGVASRPVKEQD